VDTGGCFIGLVSLKVQYITANFANNIEENKIR